MTAWKTLLVSGLLTAIFCLAGCDHKSSSTTPKQVENRPGFGPHNGAIAEWVNGNTHMHAEFIVDHMYGSAIVYVLDEDEKTAKPIAAKQITVTLKDPPATFTLSASREKTDPAGSSSRFVGKDEALTTAKDFEGTISVELDGKKFEGTFKETDEGEHQH